MKYTFGFIGAGNMGTALCQAAAKENPKMQIAIADKITSKAIKLAENFSNVTSTQTTTILQSSEYVFIGIKPQMLNSLADEINKTLDNCEYRPIFISMCAGISINNLSSLLHKDYPIIRIMPNIPTSVNEGLVLYCNKENVPAEKLAFFVRAMKGVGILDKINEDKIDAASAVSGCGPAYAFMFIEALADGAVECGISREKAILYAAQMLSGSAKMILRTDKHPAELKDAVCSPGGTTIAGVHELENRGFRGAVMNAVISAYKKNKNLF